MVQTDWPLADRTPSDPVTFLNVYLDPVLTDTQHKTFWSNTRQLLRNEPVTTEQKRDGQIVSDWDVPLEMHNDGKELMRVMWPSCTDTWMWSISWYKQAIVFLFHKQTHNLQTLWFECWESSEEPLLQDIQSNTETEINKQIHSKHTKKNLSLHVYVQKPQGLTISIKQSHFIKLFQQTVYSVYMRFAITETKLPKCLNWKKTSIYNTHNKNIKYMHKNKSRQNK